MRALLQRVTRAAVRVDGEAIGEIGPGLLVFVGVGRSDGPATADELGRRIVELRIFADADGRTNRSLVEVDGAALVVSQFTLFADLRHGRRPGFTDAADPDLALALYERLCTVIESHGVRTERGRFGAIMAVELVNDGPFTIWLDSERA